MANINKKTKGNKLDLSLVLPCYNESSHIDKNISKIADTLKKSKFSYEIILIDDKSKDNTMEHIRNISKKYSNIRVFFNEKNIGRGGTVMRGISESESDIVGFIDLDLEVSCSYIPKFVRILNNNEADVVIADRYISFTISPYTLLRLILSRGYSFFRKKLLHIPFRDTEAGYKFFKKNKIIPILPKVEDTHWFWDTEIVARSLIEGLRIKQIPVMFIKNLDKKSTVRLLPDTIDYFKAIFRFKRSLNKNKLQNKKIGQLYRFPRLYSFLMYVLYYPHYEESYKSIASLIPQNSSVVDVCCGNTKLFQYLKPKNITYIGLDSSYSFVNYAIKKGIKIKLCDVVNDEIPQADYIILQRSLYQFENPLALVKKLLRASKKQAIISESVRNLESNSFVKAFLSPLITFLVGTHHDKHFRFTEESFKSLLNQFSPKYVGLKGNRDLIAIITKK